MKHLFSDNSTAISIRNKLKQHPTNYVGKYNEIDIANRNPNIDHPSSSRKPATTSRRIPDSDIRDIFDCIYDESKVIPSHLHFTVIPSIPNGEKLSPPSLQFEGMFEIY